tara:strand:+ start:1730 stop:2014 length:285 start_codon:yes stop_codon:yes gene_type:complete
MKKPKLRLSNDNKSLWLNPVGLIAPKVFNLPTAKLYGIDEDELREIMPGKISDFFDAIGYNPNLPEERGRYIGDPEELCSGDFRGALLNRRRAF